MAGIIIADTIRASGNTLTLNSATQTVATVNATGIFSSAGNLLTANGTFASPTFSGTVTGTYTLGGTPTITAPVLSGTATGTYTLAGTPTITNPTLTLQSENVSPFIGFRNRIINGAMMIDQRNAGASVTPANTYTLDRWLTILSQVSKLTIQQNAGSVTPPAGFVNYLGATSSSAYTVVSGDYHTITQLIEGLNSADLAWGTASAKTVTLSFWVRSSLTGTFGGSLRNSAGTRSYPFTYTISSANTFEYKTVTITGDTSGTWLTTSGIGIGINFSIGTGSTFSGTAGAWAGANYLSATGATSVIGTNGATFYITGVQLERGSVASSFDYRPYGTELALCQRYFETASFGLFAVAYSTTSVILAWKYQVAKRASPTLSNGSYLVGWEPSNGTFAQSSPNLIQTSGGIFGATMLLGNFSSLTAFRPYPIYTGLENAGLTASAEL